MHMFQLIFFFLSQVFFAFLLFLVIVLSANEVETRRNKHIYNELFSAVESIFHSLFFSFLSFFLNRSDCNRWRHVK